MADAKEGIAKIAANIRVGVFIVVAPKIDGFSPNGEYYNRFAGVCPEVLSEILEPQRAQRNTIINCVNRKSCLRGNDRQEHFFLFDSLNVQNGVFTIQPADAVLRRLVKL
jgi:hypothetical protein